MLSVIKELLENTKWKFNTPSSITYQGFHFVLERRRFYGEVVLEISSDKTDLFRTTIYVIQDQVGNYVRPVFDIRIKEKSALTEEQLSNINVLINYTIEAGDILRSLL